MVERDVEGATVVTLDDVVIKLKVFACEVNITMVWKTCCMVMRGKWPHDK